MCAHVIFASLIDLFLIVKLGMFKFVRKCIDSKGLSGTKRYLGDLSKTVIFCYNYLHRMFHNFMFIEQKLFHVLFCMLKLRTAGSNVMFAAITAISDSVVKGAEINGVEGMVM